MTWQWVAVIGICSLNLVCLFGLRIRHLKHKEVMEGLERDKLVSENIARVKTHPRDFFGQPMRISK